MTNRVTAESSWRAIGDCTYAAWSAEIKARAPSSPILADGKAAYDAARPHTALCLGQMYIEDQFQTDPSDAFPITNHNPMNMKTPDGAGWMDFESYPAGIQGWNDRITSPTYKPQAPRVYAKTVTVRDLVNVYAPSSENDVTNYINVTCSVASSALARGAANVSDLTFGKVAHPVYEDRLIPNSQNSAWDNLGTRTVRAVVWHRMLGSLTGTDGYFRGEGGSRALTDYGVGVLAQDGANLDGVTYQWNDPQGQRSPWANGSVSAPYGDGLAFVNRFGVNAVNRDATAIEISGFQTTALSPKARAAICGITAYWADQAKIPWDAFPTVPGEARSFVIWHQEFTVGTGKLCPFDVVMNETNAMVEQTRGLMKAAQTGSETAPPKPPRYADPIIPAWLTADLKDGTPNDHRWKIEIDGELTTVEVFACHRPFTMTKGANRLQLPSSDAARVGPRMEVRARFMGRYYMKVGAKTFVMTEYGTHLDNSAMTPRIRITRA